jgi:uncharacterized protein (TIGR00730 family)
MPTAEEVREKLRRTLDEYASLERELQRLEGGQFRVCVFGSARIQPEDPVYQLVYRLSRALAELDVDVVTGGGPGLMEAANRGVQDARRAVARSIGLPIHLPNIREMANKHLDIKSEHRRFSSRLDEFMRLSHAVVVAPGGIGTLLELMFAWQLIQVGMVERREIILLDRALWQGLMDWMRREVLGRKFIAPTDFDWMHLVETPEEAVEIIRVSLLQYGRGAGRPRTRRPGARSSGTGPGTRPAECKCPGR